MYNETLTLTNGVKIPQLGFGTWLIPDAEAQKCVSQALAVGYRHIDTAQAYGNEHGVGAAIRSSKLKRSEIFLTSKIAGEIKTYAEAYASIEKSLETLGLDYIDLMIIHSPQPWDKVNQSDDRYLQGNREVWRALETAYKAGKVKAIGISNFQQQDIENLFESSEIKPMVNQVLCHVSNTPIDLIKYCQAKGIVMEAYSPLGHGELKDNKLIQAMAEKYKVSTAQLLIRYDLQLGMVALPKSRNQEHMLSNTEVNFTISKADMETLLHAPQIESYGDSSHFPVFGGKLQLFNIQATFASVIQRNFSALRV